MSKKQNKNSAPPLHTDDQLINDMIENRKRQMKALEKIITSIENTPLNLTEKINQRKEKS